MSEPYLYLYLIVVLGILGLVQVGLLVLLLEMFLYGQCNQSAVWTPSPLTAV